MRAPCSPTSVWPTEISPPPSPPFANLPPNSPHLPRSMPPWAPSRSNAATPPVPWLSGSVPWNWVLPTLAFVIATPCWPIRAGCRSARRWSAPSRFAPISTTHASNLRSWNKTPGTPKPPCSTSAPCARSRPLAPSPGGAHWPMRCSISTAAPKPDRLPPKRTRMPPATPNALAPRNSHGSPIQRW